MLPIAGAAYAALANESLIVCDGLGNIRRLTTASLAEAICATPAAVATIQGCLRPYPIVAAGVNTTVSSATNVVTGQTTYTVNGSFQTIVSEGPGINVGLVVAENGQRTYTVASECPNPVVNIACEAASPQNPAGDMVVTKCDGSETRFFVRPATVNVDIPPFIFQCTNATVAGVSSAVFSGNMQNDTCGLQPILVTIQGGFRVGNNTSGGSINFLVQLSQNGGPWSNFQTGGNLGITGDHPSGTEFNFSGVRYIGAPVGLNTYDFRIFVFFAALTPGSLIENTGFNIQLARNVFGCC